MQWIPVFRYGASDTIVRLSLPARPWERRGRPIGGFEKLAQSGARESFTLRRERILTLTVRMEEVDEYPLVETMVEYLQDHAGGPADVWLDDAAYDGADPPIEFLLDSPVHGEDLTLTRTDSSILELSLSIVRLDGGRWTDAYFLPG